MMMSWGVSPSVASLSAYCFYTNYEKESFKREKTKIFYAFSENSAQAQRGVVRYQRRVDEMQLH